MEQVLFAIFAHPDDESFGPSGTLYLMSQANWTVHIICVTDGSNSDPTNTTKTLRANELHAASRLIGAASTTILDFSDGSLCNQNYAAISSRIKNTVLIKLAESSSNNQSVSFLTFEHHGLTGHLDHIAVSMIVTQLYTSMTTWLSNCTTGWLKYFCFCNEQKAEDRSYFVYSPSGYKEEDIDETIDVSEIIEVKKQIILAHASQEDAKKMIALGDHLLSREHFLIYK